jgi:hypothetical protein
MPLDDHTGVRRCHSGRTEQKIGAIQQIPCGGHCDQQDEADSAAQSLPGAQEPVVGQCCRLFLLLLVVTAVLAVEIRWLELVDLGNDDTVPRPRQRGESRPGGSRSGRGLRPHSTAGGQALFLLKSETPERTSNFVSQLVFGPWRINEPRDVRGRGSALQSRLVRAVSPYALSPARSYPSIVMPDDRSRSGAGSSRPPSGPSFSSVCVFEAHSVLHTTAHEKSRSPLFFSPGALLLS